MPGVLPACYAQHPKKSSCKTCKTQRRGSLGALASRLQPEKVVHGEIARELHWGQADAPIRFREESGGGKVKEQEDTVTQIETNQTKSTAPRALRRAPGLASYWLIAKNENGWIEVLTLERDGEQMLPVFSHEEEAEMFLRLGSVGEEWGVSESWAGELVSVLYGPCAGVKEVALDPLPEMVAQRTVGLVSLLRERFIEHITARRRLLMPSELGWGLSLCEDEQSWRSEQDRCPHRGDDALEGEVSIDFYFGPTSDRQPRRRLA
jgi:hypothetical protein